MQTLADITITPVANGFVVCLSRMEQNPLGELVPFFKDMQKEMEKDQLLADLEAKNITAAKDEQPTHKLVKDSYQFVFTRFKDVLDFLKEIYGNA